MFFSGTKMATVSILDYNEEEAINQALVQGPAEATTIFYPDGTQGPLTKAVQNPFQNATSYLQYPRDLNSSRKSHSVQFQIFERKTISLEDVKTKFTELTDRVTTENINQAIQNLDETGTEFINNPKETVTNAAKKLGETVRSGANRLFSGELGDAAKEVIDRASLNIKDTPAGLISLYMPDNVQFEYAAQYENFTLADAIGSAHVPLVSAGVRAITSTIDKNGNTAARALLNYAGYVFNPQQQTMFEGIDFRSYAMAFTFTPFSKVESDVVKQIIKKFREHAAPTIVTGAAGFFFNPPSVFKIKFMYAGKENKNIPFLKTCVLENVSVDYSPNGWTAFSDGSPVQMTMALQFREVELVDRVAIQQGY
jgi:hypothetical protein